MNQHQINSIRESAVLARTNAYAEHQLRLKEEESRYQAQIEKINALESAADSQIKAPGADTVDLDLSPGIVIDAAWHGDRPHVRAMGLVDMALDRAGAQFSSALSAADEILEIYEDAIAVTTAAESLEQ
jgi:hypothetical protein